MYLIEMIRKRSSETLGRSDLGWLKSWFHFSFADYYHPKNIQFGVLRVLNDDIIAAGKGFDTHPHRDMEIISYVVEGALSHADSMGHERTIYRGEVQYMSAGTGVLHSEHNRGDAAARLLQLWILPDRQGYVPQYGEQRFAWLERVNQLLLVAGPQGSGAPITIHQDARVLVTFLEAGKQLQVPVNIDRQVYLVLIEGDMSINHTDLQARDAVEIVGESMTCVAKTDAHVLLVEMARTNQA